MRPKRPWPPPKKLLRFSLAFYTVTCPSQFCRVRFESESRALQVKVESETSKILSSHKNGRVTSSHWFTSSSQCRVIQNFKLFLYIFGYRSTSGPSVAIRDEHGFGFGYILFPLQLSSLSCMNTTSWHAFPHFWPQRTTSLASSQNMALICVFFYLNRLCLIM